MQCESKNQNKPKTKRTPKHMLFGHRGIYLIMVNNSAVMYIPLHLHNSTFSCGAKNKYSDKLERCQKFPAFYFYWHFSLNLCIINTEICSLFFNIWVNRKVCGTWDSILFYSLKEST